MASESSRTLKVTWASHEATLSSAEQLEPILESIRKRRRPTVLFLEDPTGAVLMVGVGRDESPLAYCLPDGVSYHSVGRRCRDGVVTFWSGDQLDDFDQETLVPSAAALAAARQFIEAEGRPDAVSWEADW